MVDKKQFLNTKSIVKVETGMVRRPHVRLCRKFVRHLCLRLLRLRKFVTSSFQIESVLQIETNNFKTYLQNRRTWGLLTIPVSTFTIDLVFKNCFLSTMAPYVYSRDGWRLSIYGSECQIWKTLLWCFTTNSTIDPNKDISKMRQVHVK
jgi:hypothetical protein